MESQYLSLFTIINKIKNHTHYKKTQPVSFYRKRGLKSHFHVVQKASRLHAIDNDPARLNRITDQITRYLMALV